MYNVLKTVLLTGYGARYSGGEAGSAAAEKGAAPFSHTHRGGEQPVSPHFCSDLRRGNILLSSLHSLVAYLPDYFSFL